jgi:hypothetical protein
LQQEKMIHLRGGLDGKFDTERVVLALSLSNRHHGKPNKTYRREVCQSCTEAELVEIFFVGSVANENSIGVRVMAKIAITITSLG